MTLMRYQPWSMFDQLHREINQLFDARNPAATNADNTLVQTAWRPLVDIKDEPEALVLFADVPGVDPKDIDVQAHNGVLTIKGERQSKQEESDKNFHRIERVYGSFMRQFSLPDNIDTAHISARCKDGVLEVRLPKTSAPQARRISVEH